MTILLHKMPIILLQLFLHRKCLDDLFDFLNLNLFTFQFILGVASFSLTFSSSLHLVLLGLKNVLIFALCIVLLRNLEGATK